MAENQSGLEFISIENQKIFQNIFDHSPLAIMYTDKNGVITICNERATKLFGAPKEKLVGFSYKAIKNDKMRNAISIALGGEKSHFEGNYLTVTGNVLVEMSANFSPSVAGDGSVSGVIGVFEDITTRVQTEKSLQELEERFRLAFHTSPDSININKMDGTFIDINEGFTELTGYTKKDVIGKSSKDIKIWTKPEDREKLIQELQKDGIVKNLESIFQLKDGSFKVALMSANIIMLKGEPHILSITKDITKLRETEKANQELQAHISQIQKLESIGVLAGGIAHDFNNFLQAILGNISLAKLFLEDKEKLQDLLSEAEKASVSARELTKQLLTFSKGGAPSLKTSSIEDVICSSSQFILSGSNVKCVYDFPDNLWRAKIDKGQISQTIQNLVLNAYQAMPDGGVIEISAENYESFGNNMYPLAPGEYIKIQIADNGIGIGDKIINRIFEPYFTTKQSGSGLGLTTCYSIIKQHQGHIEVSSESNAGTVFTLFLKATVDVGDTVTHGVDTPFYGKGTVLVMDDEESVFGVLSKMLMHIGFNTKHSRNGDEAIESYKEAKESGIPFVGVILDLTIPGAMGGKEAIKRLKEYDPDIKAIVSSGYSTDSILSEYKRFGFVGAASKPYNFEELREILQKSFG